MKQESPLKRMVRTETERIERAMIGATLQEFNATDTAKILGISFRSLLNKIKQYNLEKGKYEAKNV